MRRVCLIIIYLINIVRVTAQADSVAYGKNFVLNEGLYLTYSDLRHNWPIPKDKINTKLDKNQLDFYSKLIEEEKIVYTERDGNSDQINAANVWGFCQNNTVYININKIFYRMPVFGSISYFVALVPVTVSSPGYNVFINSPSGNTTEMREFLFEFYTGKLYEFSSDSLISLLKLAPEIQKNYESLSRKKKKEQATKFIRLYNEKHPIYFPAK